MNHIEQLKSDEGLRLRPYRCTAGKMTIGYGRNLDDKGISPYEAEMMFNADVSECTTDLRGLFDNFDSFSYNRKGALLNMRFQLGHDGIRKFKNMIQAIKDNDWIKAADEAKDSLWYNQVPNRAERVVGLLKSG